jgi:hypothetical protein
MTMITLKGALTSGVFGVADIGLEYWDAKDARVKPFYRATDWLRVGGVAGGVIIDKMGYKMGRAAEVGAPLFYASLPLLEKSVKDLVAPTIGLRAKQALKAGAGAGVRLGAAQGVSYARNPITPVAANGARAL